MKLFPVLLLALAAGEQRRDGLVFGAGDPLAEASEAGVTAHEKEGSVEERMIFAHLLLDPVPVAQTQKVERQ